MLPLKHIALIMDGNRRWAKSKGLEKFLGHKKGMDAFEGALDACMTHGIEYIGFWCLAKKNIQEREALELAYLYDLFRDMLKRFQTTLVERGVRLETIGDTSLLPEDLQQSIHRAIEVTKNGTKAVLLLAIAYGGQDEIVRAVKKCLADGVDPSSLTEASFSKYLDSGAYPAPDLIVRTGGDTRHSGYYLYQSEYSEYAFTPTMWPDFWSEELQWIIQSFSERKRNFGK